MQFDQCMLSTGIDSHFNRTRTSAHYADESGGIWRDEGGFFYWFGWLAFASLFDTILVG